MRKWWVVLYWTVRDECCLLAFRWRLRLRRSKRHYIQTHPGITLEQATKVVGKDRPLLTNIREEMLRFGDDWDTRSKTRYPGR